MSWDRVQELFRQDELSLLRELLPEHEVQPTRLAHSLAPQEFPRGLDLAPSAPTFAQAYLPINLASGTLQSLGWEAPTSTVSSAPTGCAQEFLSAVEAHNQGPEGNANAMLSELPPLPSAASITLQQNRVRLAIRPKSPESSHRPRIYSRTSPSMVLPSSGSQPTGQGGHIVRQGSAVSAPPPQKSQIGQPRIVTGQSPNRALLSPRSCSGDATCTPLAWHHDQEASSSGTTKSTQAELVIAGPSIQSQAISPSFRARLPGVAAVAVSSPTGAPGDMDATQGLQLSTSPSQALIGRARDEMPPQHAGMLPSLRLDSTARDNSLAMPALLSSGRTEAAGSSSSLSCTEPLQAEFWRGASLLQMLESIRGRRTVPMTSKEAGTVSGGIQLLPEYPKQGVPSTMADASAPYPAESSRLQLEPASIAQVAARPGFAALPAASSVNATPGPKESLLSFSQPAPEDVFASSSRSMSKQRSTTASLPLQTLAQRKTEAQFGEKRSRAMSPTRARNVAQKSWVHSALAAKAKVDGLALHKKPDAGPAASQADVLSGLVDKVAEKAGTELLAMRGLKAKLKAEAEELMKQHDQSEKREHGVMEVLHELTRLRQKRTTMKRFEKAVLDLVNRLEDVRFDRPPAAARLSKDLAHRLNSAPPGAAWEVGKQVKGGLLMSTALAALDTDNLLPHSLVLSSSAHAGKVVSLAQLRSLPGHMYHELAMNYMMDVGSALVKMGGDSEEALAAQQHVSRLMVEAMTITYAYGIKDPRTLLEIDPLQGGGEAGNDPQVWKRAVATAKWSDKQIRHFWDLWDEFQAKNRMCKARAESLRTVMREEHLRESSLHAPATKSNWDLVNAAVALQHVQDELGLLQLAFAAICTLRVNTPLQLGIMGAICAPALVRYDKMVEVGALVRPSKPQMEVLEAVSEDCYPVSSWLMSCVANFGG